MLTNGAKFFVGLAIASAVAVVIAVLAIGGSPGPMLLGGVLAAGGLLGGLTIYVQRPVAPTGELPELEAGPAPAFAGAEPAPSLWPLFGGFAAAITAVGALVDHRLFVVGALALVATGVYWGIQLAGEAKGGAPVASGPVNERPLKLVYIAAYALGFVSAAVYGFMRIVQVLDKDAARTMIWLIGGLVFLAAVVVTVKPRLTRLMLTVLGIGAGLAVLIGAIAGAV